MDNTIKNIASLNTYFKAIYIGNINTKYLYSEKNKY